MPTSLVNATEFDLKPAIEGRYSKILDANFDGVNFEQPIEDGHDALMLTPSLQLDALGPVWQASWNTSYTSIKILEDGFEEQSYKDINLLNNFSFLKDRFSLFVNGSLNHQNVDNRFAFVSDPIFSQGEYIDVRNVVAGFNAQTSPASDWSVALSASAGKTSFDEEDLENTDSFSTNLVAGENQQVSLSTNYIGTSQQARLTTQFSLSRNQRENQGNRKTFMAYVNLGVPVWSSLDAVVSATRTTNKIEDSIIDDDGLSDEYYGVGFAWRFSQTSYIEATYNKDSRGIDLDGEEDEPENFSAVKLVVEPNPRNYFEFEKSRRFYGDSYNLQAKHNAKRWTISLNYNEELQNSSRLASELIDAGLFECDVDNVVRDFCTLLNTPPEQGKEGKLYLNFFDRDFFFVDELTLDKIGTLGVTYNTRKGEISLTAGKSKKRFLERAPGERLEETSNFYTFNLSHRLNRRTSLLADINKSKIINEDDSLQREGAKYSLGLQRRLTRKATGTISVIRYENQTTSQTREDNRVEVTYKYEF